MSHTDHGRWDVNREPDDKWTLAGWVEAANERMEEEARKAAYTRFVNRRLGSWDPGPDLSLVGGDAKGVPGRAGAVGGLSVETFPGPALRPGERPGLSSLTGQSAVGARVEGGRPSRPAELALPRPLPGVADRLGLCRLSSVGRTQ
jgi:hypothetical protein